MGSDYKEFNESDCVAFIRQTLNEKIRDKYTDDEILFIVDLIWDYYDRKGMLSLSNLDDEDDLLDEEDLVRYVKKEMRQVDDLSVEDSDVPSLVKGELKYEQSLEQI